MAGSFGHMTNDDGTPYDRRFGYGTMLEVGGDAVEALEECYSIIWAFAIQRSEDVLGREPSREDLLGFIRDAKARKQEGLVRGRSGI